MTEDVAKVLLTCAEQLQTLTFGRDEESLSMICKDGRLHNAVE